MLATINRRVYLPSAPELDGKVLPVGFGVAVNATHFENLASQVALGGEARVALAAWRNVPDTTPEWERDFLVVEEHLARRRDPDRRLGADDAPARITWPTAS